jgi:hypothetical protein
VLLIVPTHDHASTLDLAVRSALEQTVGDLDIVIIGDGVGNDTRDVVSGLRRADERVRFVDRSKSPSRAEDTRHEVITRSPAGMVTYLGDDDLLLPHHVETMRALLEDHDFAHPFPIIVHCDDTLRALPTDLGDPRCVAWHLHPDRNTVSLTGTAHTTAAYRRLPHGWRAPPPGRWSDHFMWEQFLTLPEIRIVTAREATTIKPPTTLHGERGPAARRAALLLWWERMHDPDFATWWESEVAAALRLSAIETFMEQSYLREQVQELETGIAELRDGLGQRIKELETENAAWRDEAAAACAQLELIQRTRTWRLHDRLARRPMLTRLLARRPA